ncbi:MAG: guanine deaminase [Proteobacteria bacterium]|nr:MAG: guanine deaminase [Pseudomonadota bacterium]
MVGYRGTMLHFLTDPGERDDPHAFELFEDGLLLVEDGRIKAVGPAPQLLSSVTPGTSVTDYSGCVLMPGFIDTHIHYPQVDVIASYGSRLLDWLERYTFPAESRFGDAAHARQTADFFLDELLRNGTTTALVFASVHPISVDVFFEQAAARDLRMVCGKVLMDRNCPPELRDTPESGYRDSAELIEKWHRRERLGYAITPRFAGTSTEAQLDLAGKLAKQHPDTHVHSHMSENAEEIAWIRQLYPWSRSYLDVYDRFGLLRDRAVYAHCIHLDADERTRFARTGSAASACPTSNLFLGSGLFDFRASIAAGIRVGVGTDVGGGTSYSMLRTLSEAYKVAQLQGERLSPWRAFYLATLGGARALHLDREIGNFEPGKEADFIVLRPASTPLLERRIKAASSFAEKLFALMMLGDDRAVAATYILGRCVNALSCS